MTDTKQQDTTMTDAEKVIYYQERIDHWTTRKGRFLRADKVRTADRKIASYEKRLAALKEKLA